MEPLNQQIPPEQQVVPPVEPEIIEITPNEDILNLDPNTSPQVSQPAPQPAIVPSQTPQGVQTATATPQPIPGQATPPQQAPVPNQPIPPQSMAPRPMLPQQQMPIDMIERIARLEAEAVSGRQAQQELEKLKNSGQQNPALKAELERKIKAAQEYLGDGFDPVAGMINGIVSAQSQEVLNTIDNRMQALSTKMQQFEQMQNHQQKIQVANAWVKDFITKGVPEDVAYNFVDGILRDPRTQNYDATTLGSIIGAEAYKYMSAQRNAEQQPTQPMQTVPQPQPQVPTQPAQVPQPVVPSATTPQIAAQQAKLQGQIAVGAGGQPAAQQTTPAQLDSLILQQSLRQNMW